jgi:hypothetical protein
MVLLRCGDGGGYMLCVEPAMLFGFLRDRTHHRLVDFPLLEAENGMFKCLK